MAYDPLNDRFGGFDYSNFLDIETVKLESSIADNLGLPFVNRFACFLNGPSVKYDALKDNGWLEFQVMDINCSNFLLKQGGDYELNGARRFFFQNRDDSDLEITFLDTPDMIIRRFFYWWMNLAANPTMDGIRRYYMKDYVSKEFVVVPLDYKGTGYYADKFLNVFPYEITSIPYSYSRNNEILKTTVRFKFMYHHIMQLHSSDNYHIKTKGA